MYARLPERRKNADPTLAGVGDVAFGVDVDVDVVDSVAVVDVFVVDEIAFATLSC